MSLFIGQYQDHNINLKELDLSYNENLPISILLRASGLTDFMNIFPFSSSRNSIPVVEQHVDLEIYGIAITIFHQDYSYMFSSS